jgi:hypothetical protein
MSKPTAGVDIPKVACISGNAGDIPDSPLTAISVRYYKGELRIWIAIKWPSALVLAHSSRAYSIDSYIQWDNTSQPAC